MSLINPLDAFPDDIPKMEETSIFASLTIGKRGRSIIEIENQQLKVLSETGEEVNFLGFNKKTQSYTTNWSEIPGKHLAGQEPEGFGMKSINIEVNSSYVPKVTIEFIDIRGSSLFNIGSGSKYAGLFQFPPPEFTLTIKGYFGKSLTYGLHLIKQNTRFNSKTGNFEITAGFIAITFAPLADIPVAYIKAAPFMKTNTKVIDTNPTAGNVDTFYELINSSRILNKNIEQIKQGGSFKDFTDLGDEIELLKDDLKQLNDFSFLKGEKINISSFKSTDKSPEITIIDVKFDNINKEHEIITDKSGFFSKTILIDDLQKKDFISQRNKINEDFEKEIKRLIKTNLTDEDIINNINVKGEAIKFNIDINGKAIKDDIDINLRGKITGLSKTIKTKETELDNINKKRKKLCDQITKEVGSQTKSALGFNPTIYNIFKIMCDDTDTFINLLKKTSEKAQQDTSLSNFINSSAQDAKVSDETKQNKIVRYAWPEIIENKGNKKNVRIYPGENSKFNNMPEVKFVEKFIEASIEIALGEQTKRKLDSSDDEGKKEWTPLGPFEEVSFATGSDYGRNRTSVANIMGTLVKRAQIIVNWNLRHDEQLGSNEIRVLGGGSDKGGVTVDKETTGTKLIENLGILEGQNILHEVVDIKILQSIKEISKKTAINDILNTSYNLLNLNGISNVKPLNLYNNSTTNIDFNHSGENDGNFRSYKYFNEDNISSAFKIKDSGPNLEEPKSLKEEIKGIKEAAEEGFINWLSSLFGNDPHIQITDENKVLYKDTREKESESTWFENNIANFSFPPLEDFDDIVDADKINHYSNTILKPLFKDGNSIPGLANPVDNFLFNLFNIRDKITTNTSIRQIEFNRNAIEPVLLNKWVGDRNFILPGVIEIPYIVLAYWGWLLFIIDKQISIKFNLSKFKFFSSTFKDDIEFKKDELFVDILIGKENRDYFKSLSKIVKDQLIEQYENFRDITFPEIKKKILKDPLATILELNPNQFQQDINDIKNWGKPISGDNNWWEDLTKRKYIFLGLPLLLVKPKSESLKGNILDINPTDRRDNVSSLIRAALRFLGKKIDDKIKEIEEVEKEIKNQLDDPEIKLAFYNSFKTINDRWLSGGFSPFGGNKLISKFSFVDRGMRDIGVTPKVNGKINFNEFNNIGDEGDEKSKSVIIDFSHVEDTIENNSMSLLTLIDLILTENGFQFFPLQNFMKFDSGNWNENRESIKNIFGFNNIDTIKSYNETPVFLCLYIDSTSSFLDVGKGDIFQDDVAEVSDIESEGGKVNAFIVKYGDPNQSMFKDIKLDQAEFKETIESIKILDKISQIGSEDVSAKTILKGQNLFNTYEQRSYSCEIEMLGNAMIQPTQYFQLENVPMFHGAYMIIQVHHSITPNQMTTNFKGVRIPKNSLPLVTDYAAAIGFNICEDSSVEGGLGSSTKSGIGTLDKDFIGYNGAFIMKDEVLVTSINKNNR